MSGIFLILIVGAIITFLVKPSYYFYYILVVTCLFFPVLALLTGARTAIELSELDGRTMVYFNYLNLGLFVFELIQNKGHKTTKALWLGLAVLFIYLLICCFIRGMDEKSSRQEIMGYVSLILPLLLMEANPKFIPSLKSFKVFFISFVLIEIFIALLNFRGFYLMYAVLTEKKDNTYITGTFRRFNVLGNFLTTVYLLISLIHFSNKGFPKVAYILLSIGIFIVVLLTGARVSFILMFVIVLGCIFLYTRKRFVLAMVVSGLIGLGGYIMVFTGALDAYTHTPGVGRVVSGIQEALGEKRKKTVTTDLSSVLLEKYGDENPIFGNLRLGQGESAYNKVRWSISALKYDAKLAFLYIEYGILGLCVFMFFFRGLFVALKGHLPSQDYKQLYLSALYLGLLTVTENGIFDAKLVMIVTLYLLTTANSQNDQISRVMTPKLGN